MIHLQQLFAKQNRNQALENPITKIGAESIKPCPTNCASVHAAVQTWARDFGFGTPPLHIDCLPTMFTDIWCWLCAYMYILDALQLFCGSIKPNCSKSYRNLHNPGCWWLRNRPSPPMYTHGGKKKKKKRFTCQLQLLPTTGEVPGSIPGPCGSVAMHFSLHLLLSFIPPSQLLRVEWFKPPS